MEIRGITDLEDHIMRAHHVMTKDVVAVTPHTTIEETAKIMLRMHISGLPVIDDAGNLVGVVSESDFLRRNEIGTGRKHAAWLKFFMGPARAATEFVHERGRKVEDVMTQKVISVQEETSLADLVDLMEKHDIKRVPVMRGQSPVGIVTRTNLLQAMASLAHEIPDPTADDEHIRERITRAVNAADWRPIGFEVNVRRGVVHLHGIITTDEARRATIVAAENTSGVKEVYDHLQCCSSQVWSGWLPPIPDAVDALLTEHRCFRMELRTGPINAARRRIPYWAATKSLSTASAGAAKAKPPLRATITPISLPRRFTNAPPELPWPTSTSDWIRSLLAMPGRDRCNAETIPDVTLWPQSWGFPMAKTGSPTSSAPGFSRVSARRSSASIRSSATSSRSDRTSTAALSARPSWSNASTTVAFATR
nr:CBS domain-containing protein [Bradyrhizobium japonicum]